MTNERLKVDKHAIKSCENNVKRHTCVCHTQLKLAINVYSKHFFFECTYMPCAESNEANKYLLLLNVKKVKISIKM